MTLPELHLADWRATKDTHGGGIQTLMGAMLDGYGLILIESFVPGPAVDTLARHGVTVAGAGTAFWLASLSEQRKRGGFDRLVLLSVERAGHAA